MRPPVAYERGAAVTTESGPAHFCHLVLVYIQAHDGPAKKQFFTGSSKQRAHCTLLCNVFINRINLVQERNNVVSGKLNLENLIVRSRMIIKKKTNNFAFSRPHTA